MSTVRTTEITLASRANAYVALTKPDVSFLVLMTTAAGYYMGARGAVDWLHLIQTVFATLLDCGRYRDSKPLHRTRLRPLHATYGVASAAERTIAAARSVAVWLGSLRCGRAGSVFHGRLSCFRAWGADVRELSACVHAAEKAHRLGHRCRRISGSDSSDDWMGRRYRHFGSRRLAALRDSIFLAISAFLRHRLDVSRRLRPRGHPDAAGRGPRRNAYVSPDHSHSHRARGSQSCCRPLWDWPEYVISSARWSSARRSFRFACGLPLRGPTCVPSGSCMPRCCTFRFFWV